MSEPSSSRLMRTYAASSVRGIRNSRSLAIDSRGFTLVELLLTIALIALFSSLFVLNIDSMLRQGEIEVLENEFWDAVEQARQDAVFRQSLYTLSFDDETRSFEVVSGTSRKTFAVDTASLAAEVEVEVSFKETLPADGYRLIRGELVTNRDLESVSFFPDGTCSPFSVELRISEYESVFQIDPWTGAAIVSPSEDG